MKIIILYGPPATGKLTIAKELAKKTGYKLFDNHHTMDFLSSIILDKTQAFKPKVSGEFSKIYMKVVLDILKTTCKLKDIKGLIITEAYTGEKRFINRMIKIAKTYGHKVYMVKLTCDIKKLEKRVYDKSRLKYNKVKSKDALHDWFERFKNKGNLVYPYKKTLILDNTNQSVNASVKEILKFLK